LFLWRSQLQANGRFGQVGQHRAGSDFDAGAGTLDDQAGRSFADVIEFVPVVMR